MLHWKKNIEVNLAIVIFLLLFSLRLEAFDLNLATGSARGVNTQSSTKRQNPRQKFHKTLLFLRSEYRQGNITRKRAWEKLDFLSQQSSGMNTRDRIMLVNTQASLLLEAGYPILAAIYSSQALRLSENPLSSDVNSSWNILKQASNIRPIQTVLEVVADETKLAGKHAPIFGSDWNYFLGGAYAHKGEVTKAIEAYQNLKYGDKHYFAGKYQESMLLIDMDKLNEAEVVLKKIINPHRDSDGILQDQARDKITDFAYISLGRIYYELQKFSESVRMYRKVNKFGMNFYDSLFEQAWAFFMGGFPMHALGALHGAESPFYENVFNPEATLLRSMIHYWLCRYDDSRNALADFMEKYQPSVEQLKNFLDRKNLNPEMSYQLFEDLITGVSSQSLGLPKAILETAAEKDSMLFIRDQYAAVLAEKSRFSSAGIYGTKIGTNRALAVFDKWIAAIQKDIGRKYLAELTDMKREFERLYSQAEFLYVELLMSEKDQILGKELHASTKITKVSSQLNVRGWGEKTQAWRDPRNGEFWWDEIGYYIAPVNSMCQGFQAK